MTGLTAPYLLGWLADRLGFSGAYGMVMPLLLLALIATVLADRLVGRREQHVRHAAEDHAEPGS